MGSVIFKFLVGGVAGLLVWMLMEPSAPQLGPKWDTWESMFVFLLGAAIGGAVGGLDGFSRGGKINTLRGAGLGLLFGAVAASLGHSLSGGLVVAIFGSSVFTNGLFVTQVLARILAFVPIGMFLGAAIGASSLSTKKAIQGMIGGAIGGAVGGSVFDVACLTLGKAILTVRGQSSGEVGTPGRAIMAIVLGAMIGLFIGLVERLSRSAWIRLTLGRNEGKEWSIDGPQTFVGSREGVQIPLFGDPNVIPLHASIQRQNGQYVIYDGGSPIGTYVNGQRVQQAILMHGSQIQVGGFALTFLMKNQPAPVRGPEAYAGQAYSPYSQPAQSPAAFQPQPQPLPQGYQPTQALQQTQVIPSVASSPTMMQAPMLGYALTAIDGPMVGQRFNVTGPIDVGRESPQISLAFDSAASRRHANVTPTAMGIQVTDLNSTNGTFVNGQRVSQANAAPGDMIKIGSTTFRVETS